MNRAAPKGHSVLAQMFCDSLKKSLKALMGPQALDNVRRCRTFFRFCVGRDVYFRPDANVAVELLGGRPITMYGAWYAATEGLSARSIIYSVGVGDDISFDLALISRFGCKIHAIDPTPESHVWLSKQTVPEEFILHRFGVAAHDGVQAFHPASVDGWVSHSIFKTQATKEAIIELPVKRIVTIMKELGHSHLDLLKMDIEGSEYDVLEDVLESGVCCDQLLVEFHHRNLKDGRRRTRATVSELRSAGYQLVKMAGNGEEFCFLKRTQNLMPIESR
jgi:FkbM family methyltransferase